MSEKWKEEFFEWKDEIESKFNNLSQKTLELEAWRKIEEEQHQNITKALDNFVIDAGAIGDSVYSNNLKSLENELVEQKKMIQEIEETIVLNTCREITKPYCPMRIADLDQIEKNNKQIGDLKKDLYNRHSELAQCIKDELNELKDLLEANATVCDSNNGAIHNLVRSYENFEVVLRELSSIQEDFLEYIKEDYDDGTKIYERFIERVNKVKEKLDPKSIHNDPILKECQEKFKEMEKQTEKREKTENPYLDLGMITSKDGELSDYNPSQFIRDYAKIHTLFSLRGLIFPEEDSGSEKELGLPKRENGLNHPHGKSEGKLPLLNSKLPDPIKECSNCGFAIDHRPATYFGYAIECLNSGSGTELDYWCTSWKPKEKTEPEEDSKRVCLNCSFRKRCPRCGDLAYNKLIEELLERFSWVLERIEFHTENPDSELIDEISKEYEEWQGRLKK